MSHMTYCRETRDKKTAVRVRVNNCLIITQSFLLEEYFFFKSFALMQQYSLGSVLMTPSHFSLKIKTRPETRSDPQAQSWSWQWRGLATSLLLSVMWTVALSHWDAHSLGSWPGLFSCIAFRNFMHSLWRPWACSWCTPSPCRLKKRTRFVCSFFVQFAESLRLMAIGFPFSVQTVDWLLFLGCADTLTRLRQWCCPGSSSPCMWSSHRMTPRSPPWQKLGHPSGTFLYEHKILVKNFF